MDQSISLISTIQKRKFELGYEAYMANRTRDSHDMNPGSPAIADFQAGWDQAAKEHYGLSARQQLDVAQAGRP